MEQKKPEIIKTFLKLVEEVFSLAYNSMSLTHRVWQSDYEKEFFLRIEKVKRRDFSDYTQYSSENDSHESITRFMLPEGELLYERFITDNTGCDKNVLSFGGTKNWKKYMITELTHSEEKKFYLNPDAISGKSEEELLVIGQKLYPFRKCLKNSHFFRRLMQQVEAGTAHAGDMHYFQFSSEFYEKWLYFSKDPVRLLENFWQYNLWHTEKTGKNCIEDIQQKYTQAENPARGNMKEVKEELANWIDKKHLNEKLNGQLPESYCLQKNKKI